MPRLLIITADDYGLTEGINRGVDACVDAGSIQSVCVMTNMPFWTQIESLAIRHPELTVGIHWNVTQGRPVLPPGDVPSLVDVGGEFLPPKRFRARFHHGGVALRELEAELEAQVVRMREVVPSVAYWNTHQNSHVTWGLYAKITALARRLGIPAMRSHRRLIARGGRPALGYNLWHPVFWLKGLVLGVWASNASRRGAALPVARVVEPEYPPGYAKLLAALQGTHWTGAAELVTHPALNLEGLRPLSTMLESRLAEFHVLADPGFPERLASLGIEIANFDAVGESGHRRLAERAEKARIRLSGRSPDRR